MDNIKVAVLSNINVDPIKRLLENKLNIFNNQGYGEELGELLNPKSELYHFEAEFVFLIMDLPELLHHKYDDGSCVDLISCWFVDFLSGLKEDITYYISDAYLHGSDTEILSIEEREYIEGSWNQNLYKAKREHDNIRYFELRKTIDTYGKAQVFSSKNWYLGKIPFSFNFCKIVANDIFATISMESRTSKKMLIIDLDNTIWGGLVGENDDYPIKLSEDHEGAVYKDIQRILLQFKNKGVVLGIVSKNNEDDVMEIIRNHPHMVLKEEDFAIRRINWEIKSDNIKSIASELNIGIDSICFLDDSRLERQEVKELIPAITIIEFPDEIEKLPYILVDAWNNYFRKPTITLEDLIKTESYLANYKRKEIEKKSITYEEYLRNLNIILSKVDTVKNIDRITELNNKTNQFNLTGIRHTRNEIRQIIDSLDNELFAYRVSDCFGDSGIVAEIVIDMSGETPMITEFEMSCRVMGRMIENAIIDDVENFVRSRGYTKLLANCRELSKNSPVRKLYLSLGYTLVSNQNNLYTYEMKLSDIPRREYYLSIM